MNRSSLARDKRSTLAGSVVRWIPTHTTTHRTTYTHNVRPTTARDFRGGEETARGADQQDRHERPGGLRPAVGLAHRLELRQEAVEVSVVDSSPAR